MFVCVTLHSALLHCLFSLSVAFVVCSDNQLAVLCMSGKPITVQKVLAPTRFTSYTLDHTKLIDKLYDAAQKPAVSYCIYRKCTHSIAHFETTKILTFIASYLHSRF